MWIWLNWMTWVDECARLPHIKLERWHRLFLPQHLKVNIYTDGALEEKQCSDSSSSSSGKNNSTCRTRTTCSNNNISSKLLLLMLLWNNLFGLVLSFLLHVCSTPPIPSHPIFPLSQSIVSQAFSHSKCVCVYITNDNRLHFQTFTTFFILMVRVHVRIIRMCACVSVCASVFMDKFVCFFALIDNRWLCFDVRKKKMERILAKCYTHFFLFSFCSSFFFFVIFILCLFFSLKMCLVHSIFIPFVCVCECVHAL